MEPPATISAPDPTEPSTVTSPSVKMIDWPERTGLSSSNELAFGLASRFACASVRVITQGRPPVNIGGMPVGLHALDAEDADIALFEIADEMRDRALAEVDAGEVEHDGLSDEEAGRGCQ